MVEGTGLENRQARKGLVGSNPTLSAIQKGPSLFGSFLYVRVARRTLGSIASLQ